jgi:hypothetical protein
MSERKVVHLSIEIEEGAMERLKSQIRNSGEAHLSATQAVLKAIDLFMADAGSVKLSKPERMEIESRSGAQVPIRKSADILRAFERVAGGPNSVLIDIDPGVASEMRDFAMQTQQGFSEYCKTVLESACVEGFFATCELQPIFFKPAEMKKLTEVLSSNRIPSGGALLSMIMALQARLPAEEKPCRSTSITVPAAG